MGSISSPARIRVFIAPFITYLLSHLGPRPYTSPEALYVPITPRSVLSPKGLQIFRKFRDMLQLQSSEQFIERVVHGFRGLGFKV